jgi:hypothetical protein
MNAFVQNKFYKQLLKYEFVLNKKPAMMKNVFYTFYESKIIHNLEYLKYFQTKLLKDNIMYSFSDIIGIGNIPHRKKRHKGGEDSYQINYR